MPEENKMTITAALVITPAALFLTALVAAGNIALDAFVALKVWAWLIEPETGLGLTAPVAIGASLLSALWTHQFTERSKESFWKSLRYTFTTPLILLAAAFVAKAWLG
jgi:hypothetical protein